MKIIDDTKMKVGWFVNKIHPFPFSATFVVKGTFDLHPGGEATLSSKQENLNGDVPGPDGDLYYASDFALFKPKTDVLLSGTCYSRGGKPTPVSRVTFQVGNWSKQLVVIGNRTRQRKLKIFSTTSDPEPFKKMKLSYALSYGGEKYRRNPIGRGHRDGENPFPNLVEPEQVVISHTSHPQPAGFGAIPPAWLQRTHGQGTYGRRWEKERWPGFPADYDWSMQNAAPYDQQLLSRLKGDEKLFFENLHPEHAVYESGMPGIRARWFLREELPAGPRFREVRLELDTLWVDMDEEKLVLLWRGTAGIQDPDFSTVTEQVILAEPPGSPAKSLEEVATLLEKKKTPAPLPPLPPKTAEPGKPVPDMTWKKELEERIASLRKDLARLDNENGGGPDLSDLAGILPPPGSEPEYGKTRDFFQGLETSHPELAEKIGPPPSPEEFEKGMSKPEKKIRTAWSRDSCMEHASGGGSFDGEDLRGLDLSGLGWEGISFQGTLLNGTNLARARLTEANLSGAGVSDANLSDADLGGANLTSTDLARALLSGANLSGATLQDTDCSGASMQGANLSRAKGRRTTFFEANLEGANLSNANLPDADLTGANITGVTATEANLANARAGKIIARQANLSGARLTGLRAGGGADFSESRIDRVQGEGSIWQGAILDRVNFRESFLAKSNFAGASLKAATLDLCDLKQSNFPGATLEKATLLKANLFQNNFRGAHLRSCDFRGSNLFESEFLDAKMEGNAFDLANLGGTKLA